MTTSTAHDSHSQTFDVENVLVHMKDRIGVDINNAFSPTTGECLKQRLARLDAVAGQLCLIAELWSATDYAYKGREICDRVDQQLFNVTADIAAPNNAIAMQWIQSVEDMRTSFREVRSLFTDN